MAVLVLGQFLVKQPDKKLAYELLISNHYNHSVFRKNHNTKICSLMAFQGTSH